MIVAGLLDPGFIERASGYAEFEASVEPFTLAEDARITGVPAAVIRALAHS